MLRDILIQLYERDIEKVKTDVNHYTNEADIWRVEGEITNSAGNLVLHIIGNLKHFVGAVLGGSDYLRDRDLEFSDSGVSRGKLLAGLDETAEVIKNTVQNLTDEDFAEIYPIEVFGNPMTTEYFLIHLATHLNWHLGQIDYHRRILAQR